MRKRASSTARRFGCVVALSLAGFLLRAPEAGATVTGTSTQVSYVGDGVNRTFPVPFKFMANGDLVVTVTTPTGASVSPGGYSVTGAGANSGTLTFNVAPSSGNVVLIARDQALTQPTNFRSQSTFSPATYENAYDRATLGVQQVDADLATLAQHVEEEIASLNDEVHGATDSSSVLAFGSTTPRTLTVRFNDWVVVSDYGATGDGVAVQTSQLQGALNSGAGRIVYFPPGTYVTGPLFVPSNTTIMLTPGTTILAKPGTGGVPGFARLDVLLNVVDASNVTIYGNGGTLKMQRAEYAAYEATQHSEWRHALSINSSSDVRVYDLNLKDTGGDGVYVGADSIGGTGSARVLLSGLHTSNAWRNGLSIVSCDLCDVRGGLFELTSGVAPQYGIDVEPNTSSDTLKGIRVSGVMTRSNAGGGIVIAISNFALTSKVVADVVVDSFTSDSDGTAGLTGLAAVRITGNVASAWPNAVSGTVVVKNGSILSPHGTGLQIAYWDAVRSPRAIVEDVNIVNANGAGTMSDPVDQSGVLVFAGPGTSTTMGNFELRRVKVADTRTTPLTYVPLYLYNGTSSLSNYVVDDCYGSGFTPTVGADRQLLHLGTSSDMIVKYSQSYRMKHVASGTESARDYVGRLIESSGAGTETLPAASSALGSVWRFRNGGDYTWLIRPADGDIILQYGKVPEDVGHTVGELVLRYQGDYIELEAAAPGKWQVRFTTARVNNPRGDTLAAPPLNENWCASIPTIATANPGDICWHRNPTAADVIGWVCVGGATGTCGTWVGMGYTSASGVSGLTIPGPITISGGSTKIVDASPNTSVVLQGNLLAAGTGIDVITDTTATRTAGNLFGVRNNGTSVVLWSYLGTPAFPAACNSTGSPGNATCNQPTGRASVASGSGAVTITNSEVTTTSRLFLTLQTADATCTFVKSAVPAAGSFAVTLNANCTAITTFAWKVEN